MIVKGELPQRKFAHEPLLDVSKGVIKGYCRCGSQTKRRFDSAEEAMEAHKKHVGLKELQRQDGFS